MRMITATTEHEQNIGKQLEKHAQQSPIIKSSHIYIEHSINLILFVYMHFSFKLNRQLFRIFHFFLRISF